jgi:endonuclease I
MLVLFFSSVCFSFGQGSENFSNAPSSGNSYADGSFVGNNSITWNYVQSRWDFRIDGNTAGFGRTTSALKAENIPNGIGTFRCKLKKVYTSSYTRKVEVFVNGESKGILGPIDGLQEFVIENINVSGAFSLELKNKSTKGKQLAVDDISWTAYGSVMPVAPKVSLSVSKSKTNEADAETIKVKATLSETRTEATVVALTVQGTDVTSTDYQLSSTQITIPAGDLFAEVDLQILNDSDEESTEQMNLSITSQTAGVDILNGEQTVTILDDERVVNDGTEAMPFTIEEAIALSISKTKYFAQGYIVGVGNDFTAPFASTYYITVADSKDETDLSKCLNLKLESGVRRDTWNLKDNPDNLGAKIKFNGFRDEYSSHQSFEGNTIIEEQDALPKVSLSASATSGTEADQTVITFTAKLDKASNASQTVDVAISGTGIASTDYTLSATQLTFPASETTKTFTVTVADDSDDEGDETMTVALQSPSAGIKLGTTVQKNISIVDNDNIKTTVQFASTQITKNEDAGTIQIPLNLVNPSANETQVNISLPSTSDISSYSQTVTFAANETTANVTVAINDDQETENNEQFTFTITSVSGGTQAKLGTQTTCNLVIVDNDGSQTGVLANYVYLDPQVNGQGKIVVNMTPKEYVASASESHHMKSVLIPENYYKSAVGFSNTDLRTHIQTIINTDAKAFSYSFVWTMCENADENPKNSSQVWQIYVEEGEGKSSHVSGATGWNREHVWAKSHGDFGTATGPGTDGHHLRAAQAGENSTRGSKDFANVSPGYTPPKSARGDVARMIFYMAVRYGYTVDNQVKHTESAARHGKLDDLLKWHEEDPVDPYEVRRNNVIYGYQKNRNPFVDHPELVQYIFGDAKSKAWDGGVGAKPMKLTVAGSLTDFGLVKFGTASNEQSFSISAQDLSSNVMVTAPAHFQVAKQGGSFGSSVELPISNGNLSATTILVKFVPTSAVGNKISDRVSITSGGESTSLTVSGTEGDPALVPTDIYTEDFNTTSNDWVMYSVASNKDWHYSTSKDRVSGRNGTVGMAINNYGADGNSEDWLISPLLQLSSVRNPEVHYWINSQYSGSTLELMYSTDYSGSGNPTTATWTSVESTTSFPTSYTEKTVNLSVSENIYFAFKHTSGKDGGKTTAITIDDFSLKGLPVQYNGSLACSNQAMNFEYVSANETSATQNYQLSFNNLEGDITVTASEHFQISTDGSIWNTTLNIAQTAVSPQTIQVRFAPTKEFIRGANGNISHEAQGAASKTVSLSSAMSSDISDANNLGHDKTLDIVSWNVEWFGAPSKSKHASSFDQQLTAVSAKMIELNADIYALQEAVKDDLNGDFITPLVNKLNELAGSDRFEAAVGPRYSYDFNAPTSTFPAQRICFIYDKNTVKNKGDFSMFSNLYQDKSTTNIDGYTGSAGSFWASGRLPHMMEADVTINGVTETISFINFHAKCCDDSYDRKLADASFLLDEMNTAYSDKNLVVLGDYNDYVDGSMTSGKTSPYASWYTNKTNFDHVVTASSNIDHISISNELYDEYQLLDNSSSESNVSISDHSPIMLRMKFHSYKSSLLAENASQLNFDFVDVANGGTVSNEKTYTLKGTDLSADVNVVASTGFELSLDGTNWSSSLTIAQANAAEQAIKVRYRPAQAYESAVTGTIKHSTKDAKALVVDVKAYGRPDVLAPEFVSGYPSVDKITHASFELKTKINEAGKIYYAVFADEAITPSVDEIKAGTNAITSGNYTIQLAEVAKNIKSLSPSTNYDVYVLAEDNNEPVANLTTPIKLDVQTNNYTLLPFEYVTTVTKGSHYASYGIPANYYKLATGAKGDQLKSKIATIINANFVSYPYEEAGRGDVDAATRRYVTGDTPLDVYDIMDLADQNPNNPDEVYMIYKEKTYARAAKHLGRNGSQEIWNREHVYPQSTGGFKNARAPWGSGSYANGNIIQNAGNDLAFAQSDAHHLRSSDRIENSLRNNYPFSESPSGSEYEPPLSAKGDVARVLFYLNVRYGLNISAVADLETLLKWNEIDPVDPYEVRRNNVVFEYQKNRNPFIDHPELVTYIYGNKTNEVWLKEPKQAQTITFDPVSNKMFGDNEFALTAHSSSNLPVTFELVSGPATLKNNIISITGAGSIVVKAIQPGNEDFEAATAVVQTITIEKASQTITFAEIQDKVYRGADFKLVASSSSNLEVEFELITGPAILKGKTISIIGVGDILVKATQVGNKNYKAANEVYQTITVNKASQNITFNKINDKVYGDAKFELIATSTSKLPVEFELVSGSATLENNVISITGAGTIVVTAYQKGNSFYKAATAVTQEIIVGKASQTIAFEKMNNQMYGTTDIELVANSTSNLPVEFKVVRGPVKIENNTMSITGVGEAVVEAIQNGNENYKVATPVPQTIIISKAHQVVTFEEITDKVYGDTEFTLVANSTSNLPVAFELISGPATIENNTVSITGVGEIVVEAVQNGNDNYEPAVVVRQTITVAKASQAITFDEVADKVYGDSEFALVANSTSNLPVAFELISGPATLENNVVTITGVGEIVVEATQIGNENYEAATKVTQRITVSKATQTITFDEISDKVYGDTEFELVASSTSNLSVEFTLVSGPATIENNTVSITGVGEIVVEAVQNGNDNYEPAVVVHQRITVAKASQTITFEEVADKMYGDSEFALVANSTSNLPVAFELISGPARLENNIVTITGAGEIIVEATQIGNENYEAATKITQTITVAKASQTITFEEITDKVYGDTEFTLVANSTSNLPVAFELISGPATIENNTVSITGVGEIVLEAVQSGNDNYEAATVVRQTITVAKASQTITFEEVADKMYGDSEFALVANSTSNLPVAFELVSGPATLENNIVTITGVGEIVVEATQIGNGNYEAATKVTQRITVSKATQTITFDEIADKVYGDTEFELVASSTSNLPVEFTLISGPATIENNTVSITGVGEIVVEAVQGGNDNYEPAVVVRQTITVAKANQTITFDEIVDKVYGDAEFALVANSSSNLPVTFELVSGPATLENNIVTITGAGEIVVEATQDGNEDYEAATKVTQIITVAKATQTITFEEIEDKTFGDAAFALNATSSLGLPVHFEVKKGSAHIDGNMLTIDGAGEVIVIACQEGDNNCSAAAIVEHTFMIQKADQTIDITDIIDKVTVGKEFQLEAEASSGLTIEFEIVKGTGTLDGNSILPEEAGEFVIKVYQAGNDNYNEVEIEITFTASLSTGVEDDFSKQVKLFPNPAKDYVNLVFPLHDQKQIVILNNAGQIVRQLNVEKSTRINLSGLPAGLYVVKIQKEEIVLNKKLMIVE